MSYLPLLDISKNDINKLKVKNHSLNLLMKSFLPFNSVCKK